MENNKPLDAVVDELVKAAERGDVLAAEDTNQKQILVYPVTHGSAGYDTKINYVIKGWLPAQSFGVLYGASGHFKSFHAVSWACCIAAGKEWNGARVNEGAVLYIVGEGGLGTPRRFRGWEVVYNGGGMLKNLYKIDGAIYPAEPQTRQIVVETIQQLEMNTGIPVRMVVIDTLARCFAGGDENRSDDMGAFIAGCDYIKQHTGATVLVVHHTGKNTDAGARGSSALRAACDFEFAIRRLPEEQGYIIKNTKSKDSCEQPEKAFLLTDHVLFIDDDNDEVTTLVPSLIGEQPPEEPEIKQLKSDNHKLIIKCINDTLAAGNKPFVNFIRDELKANDVDVKNYSRWLKQLSESGKIKISENGMITLLNG